MNDATGQDPVASVRWCGLQSADTLRLFERTDLE